MPIILGTPIRLLLISLFTSVQILIVQIVLLILQTLRLEAKTVIYVIPHISFITIKIALNAGMVKFKVQRLAMLELYQVVSKIVLDFKLTLFVLQVANHLLQFAIVTRDIN